MIKSVDKKFGWCFIGTGSLAKTVAKQLLSSGRHEIVSCYTRNPHRGEQFANNFGCDFYKTAEAAMTAPEVDGVYIVTPHNAHYRYAVMALELGKPTLVEKAFTVTATETDELISLARERGVYLAEAMWTWFSRSAQGVKAWVDSGMIGRIRSADFTYHIKTTGRNDRHEDKRRAGGALLDITIYPITYAYRLWGMPIGIEASGTLRNGIDLGEEITLSYPNFKVNISGSIDDFRGLEWMRIYGEGGEISSFMYHCTKGATCKTKGRRQRLRVGGPLFNSYLDEFDAVARDVREGRRESSLVPLRATSDVMHILDEIRRQIGLIYDDLE